MSMTVFRLMQLHQKLDTQITSEQRRRVPDDFRLQRMKRIKLAIKDRLFGLGLGGAKARV